MSLKHTVNLLNKHADKIFIGLMGVFSFWLMFSTFGYSQGNFVIDSKLYSDFGAHLPLIRSFSFGGNFPHPEYPFFHGEPIRYHYLFYLIVGWAERLGLNLALALNLFSALGFWLLLVMIYKLSKLFFKRTGAGLLAVYLFLFNGSFSWVEYFNQHGFSWQSLFDIVNQVQFASFGPWSGRLISAFWSLNIYTNQRHLGLSYGLLLWLIYLVAKTVNFSQLKHLFKWRQQPQRQSLKTLTPLPFWQQLAVVVVLALFPLLHQAGYVMFGLFFIFWLLIYSFYYWQYKKQVLRYFWPFLIGGILSLVVFSQFTTGSGQEVVKVFGYLSPDKSLLGVLKYWWFNLGLYLLLIPVLLFWSIKRKNFLLVIFSSYFVIANLVRLSPDMINNHKLVTMFMIGVNIFTAGFIFRLGNLNLWAGKKNSPLTKLFRFVLLAVLVFFLSFGGWVDIWPIINDYSGKVPDYPKNPAIMMMLTYTPPRAQVLTNTYLYNPASLAGRQLYLDYGYFAWSMGYNDRDKRDDLKKLFATFTTKKRWCKLAKKHEIDFVLLDPSLASLEDGRVKVKPSWLVRKNEPTRVSQNGWMLWDVAQICR